jgi:hypothetical protein
VDTGRLWHSANRRDILASLIFWPVMTEGKSIHWAQAGNGERGGWEINLC